MMDLTHTLTVEHADSQSDGCVWHQDPACLCDVIVKEPMRDHDYVTQPWLEALFVNCEHADDRWLHQAWDFVVGRTTLKSCESPYLGMGEVELLIENHPDLVRDLLDGMAGDTAAVKHDVRERAVQALRKFLNLRTLSNTAKGLRSKQVRDHVIQRHFGDGERVIDIYRDLQSRGVPCVEVTMYQWVQRERNERAAA